MLYCIHHAYSYSYTVIVSQPASQPANEPNTVPASQPANWDRLVNPGCKVQILLHSSSSKSITHTGSHTTQFVALQACQACSELGAL